MTLAKPVRAWSNWLVLIPSANDEAWRAAIEAGARASGLTPLFAKPGERPKIADPDTFVVTGEALNAARSKAPYVSAIVPEPSAMSSAVAGTHGLAPDRALQEASSLLAHAMSLDINHRLFTPDLLPPPGEMLEVLPRLSIRVPVVAKGPEPGAGSRLDMAASKALSMYSAGRPRPGLVTEWDRSLFQFDARNAGASGDFGPIDITGRPRYLVQGPGLWLSTGRWRVRIQFSLDEGAARHQFRIYWGSPKNLEIFSFRAVRAGVYELAMEREWSKPAPADVHIWLVEGSIDGNFTFLSAALERCT